MSISHSASWLLNFWQGLAEMLLAELSVWCLMTSPVFTLALEIR
jgi:hypothetical protein